MKFLLLFLAAFLFNSCSTSEVSPDLRYSPDKFYRRDLEFSVNGKDFKGVAVVNNKSEKYTIKVKSWDSFEYMQLTTCHRYWDGEKVGHFWSFDFIPSTVEKESASCPIRLFAGDSKSRHGFAMILFDNALYTVPNALECNGKKYKATGVSACQSYMGLEQKITFETVLSVKATPGCDLPTSKDRKIWTYKINKGICQYFFHTDSKEIAHHVTLGFDDTILKKN